MRRHKPRKTSESRPAGLDIVVTTAGRFDLLKKCLETLSGFKKKTNFNVFIVDNGSDPEERLQNDDLFRWSYDQNFLLKRLQQNVGFPYAANEGARMGSAPLLMFLSDDVILQDGAIESILDRFSDSTVGVVGIKLLFPPDSISSMRPAGRVQHVGLALNIRGEPIHPLIGWGPLNPKTRISRDAWAVTGACLTVRRELFNKVNGFHLMYGKGTFEDVTLCLQIKALGYRIVMDANATGFHYVGATAEKRNESFPIRYNLMLFQSQFAQSGLMNWNEHEYW